MDIERLQVFVRRRVATRLTGERVIHWVGETMDAPRMSVTGRSIRTLEAALRKKLIAREQWSAERAKAVAFDYRLRGFSPGIDIGIDILAAARAQLAAAQARFDAVLQDMVRDLATGSPALSMRDIAALLGTTKSTAQRCAATIVDRKPATVLREEEKEASRGTIEPIDPAIPYFDNPLKSREKAKREHRKAFIEAEYPLPLYKGRRAHMDASLSSLAGFRPTKAAIAAARREKRRRRR